MTIVEIAKTSEIPPGTMMGIDVKGTYYLIANVADEYFAMDGICSHLAGQLWKGTLTDYIVKCPKHGSRFDVRTGEVVSQVKIPLIGKAKPLRTYVLSVKDGAIFLDA